MHDCISKGIDLYICPKYCTFAPSYYRGMTETERNLLYGVVSLILPENILDQFDIVKFEEEDILVTTEAISHSNVTCIFTLTSRTTGLLSSVRH